MIRPRSRITTKRFFARTTTIGKSSNAIIRRSRTFAGSIGRRSRPLNTISNRANYSEHTCKCVQIGRVLGLCVQKATGNVTCSTLYTFISAALFVYIMTRVKCPDCNLWYKHTRRIYIRSEGKLLGIGHVCVKCGKIWLDEGVSFDEDGSYYGPSKVIVKRTS